MHIQHAYTYYWHYHEIASGQIKFKVYTYTIKSDNIPEHAYHSMIYVQCFEFAYMMIINILQKPHIMYVALHHTSRLTSTDQMKQ